MSAVATSLYEWRTHGTHHCPICAQLSGTRLTMETWQASVLPGFHKGCDCELLTVTTTAPASDTPLKPLPPGKRFSANGKALVPRMV